jgi:hypothetical protein
MMRVLYYAALAWLFLWASLAVFALVTPTDSSASLLAGIGTSIGLFVFFLAMGGAPVLLMYALVMAVNRRTVDNSSYGATLNGESA